MKKVKKINLTAEEKVYLVLAAITFMLFLVVDSLWKI